MRTAKIIDFTQYRDWHLDDQTALINSMDTLECPSCDSPTKASKVTHDYMTTYRCKCRHTWRIDADGAMLLGAKGNRYA